MQVRTVFVALVIATGTARAGAAPIIGGAPATAGQFPAVVYVTIGGYECTGTLIAPDWVLTEGACLEPSSVGLTDQAAVTNSVRVHLDALTVPTDAGLTAVGTIVDPELLSSTDAAGDAGLIHLAAPVTGHAPIKLNRAAADAPAGVDLDLIGYGIATSGGTDYGTLHSIDGVPSQGCSIVVAAGVPTASDADLLCWSQHDASGAALGTCLGDGGGPAIAMIDGAPVQVGLVAFGTNASAPATSCDGTGAATRVDHVIAWIDQTVGRELGCEADGVCTSGCAADPDCATPDQGGGGCAAGRGAGGAWLAFGVAALCLARRRRR